LSLRGRSVLVVNAALAAAALGVGAAYLLGFRPAGALPAVTLASAACALSLLLAGARLAKAPPAPPADDDRGRMEFLTNVSHELRTPLTSIRGFLDLLEQRLYEGDAEREEFFESSRFAAEHMLNFIEDTLQAARLDRHSVVPRAARVAGEDAARQVLKMLDPLGREKKLSMRLESDGRGLVRADALLLRQVLINLVGNAIKFTDRGSVTVRIVGEGRFIRFDVEDTGEGIDPAALEGIFIRFHQSSSAVARAKGGIGLGLALSRQLVELMGGTIAARSEGRDRGACISFTLPAALQAAPV
jgi:signal transduction histidine kinase